MHGWRSTAKKPLSVGPKKGGSRDINDLQGSKFHFFFGFQNPPAVSRFLFSSLLTRSPKEEREKKEGKGFGNQRKNGTWNLLDP
jgi:hypothetical protein